MDADYKKLAKEFRDYREQTEDRLKRLEKGQRLEPMDVKVEVSADDPKGVSEAVAAAKAPKASDKRG